ncbi:RNA polymerase sigma-54 factor [bacterium BMS3Abin07]|nr:RNA polymerase sigma-54 factor [bacterium BMS3Abin07]GBE32074.1 RNA polymerase sigma-54 factor [bacterium BMS3Bbin05]
MSLSQRLELKLSQKLVLTPQLQQAIKLLQMPQLELSQTINQELVENPFLEEELSDEQPEISEKESIDAAANEESADSETPIEGLMTFNVDDYFDERSSDGRDVGYFNPGTMVQPSFEQFTSKEEDLAEHLLWQLRLTASSDEIKIIGETIIGNIDENGYLRVTEEEIAASTGYSHDKISEAIRLVQTLDPPGIGARTLSECLIIQLHMLGLKGAMVEKLVLEHIPDLEKKNYEAIARKLGTDISDIISAVKIIEELDPKPGRNFASVSANYIAPDVSIEKTDSGYQIILNDESLPRLRLNNHYRKLLSNKNKLTKEEKTYLEERLRSAVWLLKSLDQRNRTIYKVTESIIKFQKEFFDNGPQFLKPLNLRDVSDDIGMHESTVSRVTSNKYLYCGHGIFPFRHFFSSALNEGNGNISSTLVKEMIKKLISEENPQKPYSDLQVSEILKQKDISIARRTVAKYREALRILPHNKRKRYDF